MQNNNFTFVSFELKVSFNYFNKIFFLTKFKVRLDQIGFAILLIWVKKSQMFEP